MLTRFANQVLLSVLGYQCLPTAPSLPLLTTVTAALLRTPALGGAAMAHTGLSFVPSSPAVRRIHKGETKRLRRKEPKIT
jgi:hypothetical protein